MIDNDQKHVIQTTLTPLKKK